MAVDIDSLQIEIEATSSDAAKKIEALTTALTGLKTAAKGGAGLTTTTKQLKALSEAAKLKIQQFLWMAVRCRGACTNTTNKRSEKRALPLHERQDKT